MAITVTEAYISGEGTLGKDSTDEYSAIVQGNPLPTSQGGDNADDPPVIMRAAIPRFAIVSEMGNTINSFKREKLGPGIWKVTAEYKSPTQDRQTNDAAFSFTTAAQKQKITHSKKTVASYGATITDASGNQVGLVPADFKGGINVTDTSVEGVEAAFPTFDFKITYYVSPGSMNQSYVSQLYQLSGKVNSDQVTVNVDGCQCTFMAGELLFLGAEGQKRVGFSDWEITLNFSANPNVTNATVGNITNIVKNGWDYLWVATNYNVDSTSKTLVVQPIAAYVERIYDYAALSPLITQSNFGVSNTQGWTTPSITGGGLS